MLIQRKCINCNDIGPLLKMIGDKIQKRANAGMREIGITARQGRLLMTLSREPERTATLKDLERYFEVAQATMAGIVSRLEDKGYVETFYDPNDRRAKMVRLTQEGLHVCEQSKHDINRMEEMLASGLSMDEREQLVRLLGIVLETIK